MAGGSGIPGGSIGAGTAPSARSACLCVVGAVAAALAAWALWPQRPKKTKEEVLASAERLRSECAAECAEIATVLAYSPPRQPSSFAASIGHSGTMGTSDAKDSEAEKLQQVVGQPLVLEAAVREAAARTATELGLGPDELQGELELFADEPAVRKAVDDVNKMHQACLEGCPQAIFGGKRLVPGDKWTPEQALEMLRELGRQKLERLQVLLPATGDQDLGWGLGSTLVMACSAAEDEVWNRLWPEDVARRTSFGPALERMSAQSAEFKARCAGIEAELEAATQRQGGARL